MMPSITAGVLQRQTDVTFSFTTQENSDCRCDLLLFGKDIDLSASATTNKSDGIGFAKLLGQPYQKLAPCCAILRRVRDREQY